MNRVTQHPFLEIPAHPAITFYHDGKPVQARKGDTVAAALTACGVRVFRTTAKRGDPRGLFCAIGQCTDCVMVVDGQPNVRTCVTLVRSGMRVETQNGLGAGAHETG